MEHLMRLTPIALALMLTACATLTTSANADIVLPPAEYDHPYKGVLKIKTVRDVRAACPDLPPLPFGRQYRGCAMRVRNVVPSPYCTIYLLSDAEIRKSGSTRELTLRHEIGHCNGWSKDHKGGRLVRVGVPTPPQLRVDTPTQPHSELVPKKVQTITLRAKTSSTNVRPLSTYSFQR
jgi:hypothetical protein